ncbi:uncharacterized protein TNCV_845651 [Trichonephila clavipes]|nr:uncharacterized protein TNCV_845651 [Trichonephila clavipes]
MSTCGKEFHIACMRSKSSCFEAAGRGTRARCRLTKSHTCSIGEISAHCRRSRRWFAVRVILYKGTLARNSRCSRHRRIDEADISTSVAVGQCVVNCLEEAIRSFTVMRKRCRSSHVVVTFRRPLSIFRVVRCSSVHCFQIHITVEMFHCTRAREILFLEGQ